MEDRLTKLEELYSNQTHAVEQMSLEMFNQQTEIAALKQQIEELKDRMDSSANDIGGHERPPHY
jgi:uncharacterized coiled-coil protein SlyX